MQKKEKTGLQPNCSSMQASALVKQKLLHCWKNGLMNASTQFVQSSSWILLQSSTLLTTFRRAEWLSGQKIVELKQAVSWHVQVFEHLQMYWSGLNRKKSRKPKVCCWSSHWSQALWSVLMISLTEAPWAFLDFLMFCKSYTPVSLY